MIKARRFLVAAAVGVLALSGCAQAGTPGVAARVADKTITEASVVNDARAVAGVLQSSDAGLYLAQIANIQVQGLVAEQVAAANGVALSDSTRQQIIAADPDLAQFRAAGAVQFADRAADLVTVRRQLGEEKYLLGCENVAVSVNPHYGTWSKQLCSLDGTMGSLSRPARAPQG